MELGLTLLKQASLTLKFWDFSFTTTIYLINRLPVAFLHFNVPYIVLFNKNLDYSFLKACGCSCFPFLKPYNHHKLEFKYRECAFLGYSTSHKGYKCLSPIGKLFISKDVVFNEVKFPYLDLLLFSSKSDSHFNNPISFILSIPIVPQPISSFFPL